jgi:hypothetical protein
MWIVNVGMGAAQQSAEVSAALPVFTSAPLHFDPSRCGQRGIKCDAASVTHRVHLIGVALHDNAIDTNQK